MSNSGPGPVGEKELRVRVEDVRAGVLHDGLRRQRLADVAAGDGPTGGLHPRAEHGVGGDPDQQPGRSACSSRSRPLARSTLIGFSVHTCLPAAIALDATSACTAGMVKLTTISTSG